MFGDYDQVLPGAAERILTMAENEQRHRSAWDTTALRTSMRNTNLGQWLGFVTAFVCVLSAVLLAINGATVVAVALVAVSATGLAGKFLGK